MEKRLNIKSSETRKHARYLIGRVMLSFGLLMSGSFFTVAMTLTAEEDAALNHILFHFGVGIVIGSFGAVLTLMFTPDFGIHMARKAKREEDMILFRKASTAMGILSLAALIGAAFIFFFTHKTVTAVFLLIYGVYLGLGSLNFGKGRKRTWSSSTTHS